MIFILYQYENLMDQAHKAPNGNLKVSLLEEAVRIADTHLSMEERFEARMQLTDAAVFSGHGEKALLSFSWCLAQYDQNPSLISSREFMWHFKWILDKLFLFPEISLETIENTLEDFRRRCKEHGYSEREYYAFKCLWAMNRDQKEETEKYYEKWLIQPKDSITDCFACELSNQARVLLYQGRFSEAYALAEPIFQGRLTCHSVPHRTYGNFLLPLLREYRWEEAASFQRQGLEKIRGKVEYIEIIHEYLEYLTIVNLDQAINLLEQWLPEVSVSTEPMVKYYFYRAASILIAYFNEREQRFLHLPKSITTEQIQQELYELAKKFDKRDETDVFTRQIEQLHVQIAELRKKVNHN